MNYTFEAVGECPDVDAMRKTYGCFPSGVTAVCGLMDGDPFGMAASSFTSVSMVPPLVSVCVDNGSRTLKRLSVGVRVGLSVLSQDQDAICRTLSGSGDRFAGLNWTASSAGSVFIDGASAWLDCSINEQIPAGDHQIVLMRVHGHRVEESEPLVFHRSTFRTLVAS